MELSNLSTKIKYLSALLVGEYFICGCLNASVIQFVDPVCLDKYKGSINSSLDTFIANDPVSIREFFRHWHKEYHPKNGTNLAILDGRFDVGGCRKDFYVGYFYQYDFFIKTNKDFVNLYHRLKNKTSLQNGYQYKLDLSIDAIKQMGLLVNHSFDLYKNANNSLKFGLGGYISYATSMQHGNIKGDAKSFGKDYSIDASSSYFYTHNYLYKLHVDDSYGFGYGFNLGVSYLNHDHGFGVKLLVNNLFSRVSWHDLPFSYVSIKTKNKSIDKEGYVQYTPSINGLEVYKNFTQKLPISYKSELSYLLDKFKIVGGYDYKYETVFPYLKVSYLFEKDKRVDLLYENRFKSFGFGYHYKFFDFSIVSDKISHISSFGLNSNLIYRF